MKKTIIYLHGLNSSCKIFNYIHSQLPEHDAIFVDYDTFNPIEHSYDDVVARLPADSEFSIISHSLGGVISYLVHARDNNLSVANIVTISAPFAGSEHARFLKWMYPSFRVLSDLSPRSSIMQEINGYSTKKCRMLSLISTSGSIPFIPERNDGVVTVRSQHASPAKKKVEISSNHFEIVQDIKAVKEIKKFIFTTARAPK
jgi:pimeloyl-ACP methyl ester carboxylesterase